MLTVWRSDELCDQKSFLDVITRHHPPRRYFSIDVRVSTSFFSFFFHSLISHYHSGMSMIELYTAVKLDRSTYIYQKLRALLRQLTCEKWKLLYSFKFRLVKSADWTYLHHRSNVSHSMVARAPCLSRCKPSITISINASQEYSTPILYNKRQFFDEYKMNLRPGGKTLRNTRTGASGDRFPMVLFRDRAIAPYACG